MSIIPHLAMLGLAAALSSPIHQHQIDFKTTSPEGIQRINQLWLVTYNNEAGLETVAQAKLVTGEYAPLIAANFGHTPGELYSSLIVRSNSAGRVGHVDRRRQRIKQVAKMPGGFAELALRFHPPLQVASV